MRRLDDAFLSLTDGILLRLIVTMTVGATAAAARSTATAKMSMPAIDIITVHWAGGVGGQQRHRHHHVGQRRRQGGSRGGVRVRFLGVGGRATLRQL